MRGKISKLGMYVGLFAILFELSSSIPFLSITTNYLTDGMLFTTGLVIHITNMLITKLSDNYKKAYKGNIIGIIAAFTSFIPIIGLIMHLATAIVIALEFLYQKR